MLTNLQLLKRETTTSADTTVVLDSRATDDGSELVGGTGSKLCGLGSTSIATADLLTGLFLRKILIRFLSFSFFV